MVWTSPHEVTKKFGQCYINYYLVYFSSFYVIISFSYLNPSVKTDIAVQALVKILYEFKEWAIREIRLETE